MFSFFSSPWRSRASAGESSIAVPECNLDCASPRVPGGSVPVKDTKQPAEPDSQHQHHAQLPDYPSKRSAGSALVAPNKGAVQPLHTRNSSVPSSNLLPFEHGTSLTALWVGHYRITEGKAASQPLFYDGLAKELMGEAEAALASQRMYDALDGSIFMSKAAHALLERDWLVVRTRYFDDLVQRSLHDHTVQAQQRNGGARPRQLQVVNLASGFDARAFRLTFPQDTVVFEVDREEVLRSKNARLASLSPQPALTCARRVSIMADILVDNWDDCLILEGFDPALPTCWIMEGILMYLDAEAALGVLRRVKALSAPGSTLACDCLNGPMRFNPNMQRRMALLAKDDARFRLFLSRPSAFMAQAGFTKNVRFIFAGDAEASFGRMGPCPFLQAMLMAIRAAMAFLYVGAGVTLGRYFPYHTAVLVLVSLVAVAEGWAWLSHEWLARRLKLILFPSGYFIEARVQ